jgi:hypothetical protein
MENPTTTAASAFERNMAALRLADPRSAAGLARLGAAAVAEATAAALREDLPADLAATDTAVLWGMGNGAGIAQLLDSRHAAVFVVGTAAACVSALHRHDFSAALGAGRLRLFLVAPANVTARELSLRECAAELIARLHRPGTALRFLPWQEAPVDEFFVMLRRTVEDVPRTVEAFAQARAAEREFDVTVVSPTCAIFDDLAQCFHRLGLKVRLLRVPDRPGVWSAAERSAALLTLASRPSQLIVSRNRSLLETHHLNAYPQPEALLPGHAATWWWDVPNVATHIDLREPRGNARSFAFARDILAHLPQGAEWLPAGARTIFSDAGAGEEARQDIDVSFVGQSRLELLHANLSQLRCVLGDLGGDARALGKELDGRRGYEALHADLADRRTEIEAAIATLQPAFPAHAYYLQYLLDMAVTAAFRVAAIERLLKEGVALAVYGDDEWLKVPGVTAAVFRGVCPHGELPALYRRSRINLNLNFMQVSSTVNPKVLDAAAAGAAMLTDYRPELDLLYPEASARPFAFGTLDELPEKISALQRTDLTQHRQAVRAHTVAHHTLQQRAHWLARRFGLMP